LAQIYGWVDETGGIHFTNSRGAIPPNRRRYSRELSFGTPMDSASGVGIPAGESSTAGTAPQDTTPDEIRRLRQRAQALKQRIDVALQARQRYLEQLRAERPIRMNPAFGRRRRRVDDRGRSLAAVERQLDAFQAELRRVQTRLQEIDGARQLESSARRSAHEIVLDERGHSRAYWQRRLGAIRARLRRAQEQRQSILEQLAPEARTGPRAFGRRGKEVLRLVRALEQVEGDIRDAEAALQALRQEAMRVGAPAAWLQ
jgi:DNA repair exonuclease SbcCD ATPase subunit